MERAWEYIKSFEPEDTVLTDCWAVARVNGRGFHKLACLHEWKRPTDERGLQLMTRAAKCVLLEFKDITMAYGHGDEYSFVFRRETDSEPGKRKSVKIATALVSQFTSAFVCFWTEFFPETQLRFPPTFECCIVAYPTDQNLRDYFTWRQSVCQYNGMYNLAYWKLIEDGASKVDTEKELEGASSRILDEILITRFSIKYINEPKLVRLGTVVLLPATSNGFLSPKEKMNGRDPTEKYVELNCDIVQDHFWEDHSHILNSKALKMLADWDDDMKDRDLPDKGIFNTKFPQRSRANSINLPVKFSYDDARHVGLQLGKIADDYKQTAVPQRRRTSLQNTRL